MALFYGSTTGNTEAVADIINEKFGPNLAVENIENIEPETILDYDFIIFGISTWNVGELESNWEDFFPNLDELDFTGKIVSIYGLGDQINYGDTYLDAMGILYDKLVEKGATIIGKTSTEGYDFYESYAVRKGMFVGLALDEDNQPDKTEERIEKWVSQLKAEINQFETLAITNGR